MTVAPTPSHKLDRPDLEIPAVGGSGELSGEQCWRVFQGHKADAQRAHGEFTFERSADTRKYAPNSFVGLTSAES